MISVLPIKYEAIAATIKPIITPIEFAFLVKIPTANTPAIGTPNSPVTNRNRSHVSLVSWLIKYNEANVPKTPAIIMMILAKSTSFLESIFRKSLF